MRAPKATALHTLQSHGRVRDLDFANNSTRGVIQELLWNSFSQLHGVSISKKVEFGYFCISHFIFCSVFLVRSL